MPATTERAGLPLILGWRTLSLAGAPRLPPLPPLPLSPITPMRAAAPPPCPKRWSLGARLRPPSHPPVTPVRAAASPPYPALSPPGSPQRRSLPPPLPTTPPSPAAPTAPDAPPLCASPPFAGLSSSPPPAAFRTQPPPPSGGGKRSASAAGGRLRISNLFLPQDSKSGSTPGLILDCGCGEGWLHYAARARRRLSGGELAPGYVGARWGCAAARGSGGAWRGW